MPELEDALRAVTPIAAGLVDLAALADLRGLSRAEPALQGQRRSHRLMYSGPGAQGPGVQLPSGRRGVDQQASRSPRLRRGRKGRACGSRRRFRPGRPAGALPLQRASVRTPAGDRSQGSARNWRPRPSSRSLVVGWASPRLSRRSKFKCFSRDGCLEARSRRGDAAIGLRRSSRLVLTPPTRRRSAISSRDSPRNSTTNPREVKTDQVPCSAARSPIQPLRSYLGQGDTRSASQQR